MCSDSLQILLFTLSCLQYAKEGDINIDQGQDMIVRFCLSVPAFLNFFNHSLLFTYIYIYSETSITRHLNILTTSYKQSFSLGL